MIAAATAPNRFPAFLFASLTLFFIGHHLWDIHLRDSFTWMDPTQYYHAASAIAAGQGLSGFLVATVYPVLLGAVLLIHDSIPVALSVHAAWILIAGISLYRICRRLDLTAWALPAFAILMAGPAMFGLSRELYLEFPLTALMLVHYAVWLQRDESNRLIIPLVFGLLMALGFAIKMTYPVFMAGPLLVEAMAAIKRRDEPALWRLAGFTLVPVAGVMLVFYLFFPGMFQYYLSIGNTAIPPMRLIGPPELASWESILFYPVQMVRQYLGWLTPLLAVGWWLSRPWNGPDQRMRWELWGWALLPVGLFVFMPVKEIRHLAPVTPALLLLAGLGFRPYLRMPRGQEAARLLGLIALIPYGLAATHRVNAPYFLDRPMRAALVEAELFSLTPNPERFHRDEDEPDLDGWRFSRSLLISGFRPNEALAIAWSMATGCTIALEDYDHPAQPARPHGYQAFTDLFLLTGFNLYNRRIGWNGRYETLNRDQALAAADAWVVARRVGADVPTLPGFTRVRQIPWHQGDVMEIHLPDQPPARSFRRTYAEEFLQRNPRLSRTEINTIRLDLALDQFYRSGDATRRNEPEPFSDDFSFQSPVIPIYFMGVYRNLIGQYRQATMNQPSTTE
ncbi:MAG TPA: hypothetical protein PKA21_15955 [Kiritimatiellia bacterium]|nr:hypothetical protein [Kiritimatiellia bacterium]HMP96401.1 hypothetical protein [Kiritimatiellia bacterium]